MDTKDIIRGLREDKDLTQQNIADLLKIGRTMYRRYETGETEIPLRHLNVKTRKDRWCNRDHSDISWHCIRNDTIRFQINST